jgi:hypothetical protein
VDEETLEKKPEGVGTTQGRRIKTLTQPYDLA